MQRLIVGNWKMNLDPHEASLHVHRLQSKIAPNANAEVVVCPTTLELWPLSRDVDKKVLSLGAQNVHHADSGAYTGETSPAMLAKLVKYAIVGHSERRAMGEDDKLIAAKVAACYRNGITPVLCVGESLSEREHKLSTRVVTAQLAAALHGLTGSDVASLVVAYEPVWAIGTGRFATPDEVWPVVAAIRTAVEDLYGEEGGSGLRVLYGGSVDAHNAGAYLDIDGIEGLLIGGASLKADEFAAIVAAAQKRPL